MPDRRTVLKTTGALAGLGSVFGLVGRPSEMTIDPPSADERSDANFQSAVAGGFQMAETVEQLEVPDRLPAVGVTNAGWVYQTRETDGWQQFELGTGADPIPSANVREHRARWFNGTVFAYPDEGSAGIRAALDALGDGGGRVQLLPGTYYCDSQIRIANSDVQLVGAGTETRLAFADGFDDDLLVVEPDTVHVRVSSLAIDGRREHNRAGSGVLLRGYKFRPVLDRVAVRNVPESGIRSVPVDRKYAYEPVFEHVVVTNAGKHGLDLGYVADLYAANVYVESTGEVGFRLFGAGSTLVHPHVYDAGGRAGIYVDESAQDTRILGAYVDRNRHHGIYVAGKRVTVSSSLIFENSRAERARYDGVVLDGARRCLVTNNVFTDLHDERWQRYGVVERGDSNANLVALNQFASYAEGPFDRRTDSGSQFSLNMT